MGHTRSPDWQLQGGTRSNERGGSYRYNSIGRQQLTQNRPTPILTGYQIFHNYVRPHMGLKGKTPAEVAGITVEGNDKWLTLIQNATKKKDAWIFPTVLKVRRGESKSGWLLSRQQKKGVTSVVIGLLLGIFAYTRYIAGDIQTAQVIGILAAIAVLIGLRDWTDSTSVGLLFLRLQWLLDSLIWPME